MSLIPFEFDRPTFELDIWLYIAPANFINAWFSSSRAEILFWTQIGTGM